MKPECSNQRGTRHLRLAVDFSDKCAEIVSMWVVEQPVIQYTHIGGPLLVRVDIAGELMLVEALADPRVVRGTYRKGDGHSFSVEDTGVVEVSVPFTQFVDLLRVRIQLSDSREAIVRPGDVVAMGALFDGVPEGMGSLGTVHTLESRHLHRHADWPRVAAALGVSALPGTFEIWCGPQNKFRWRLIRADEVLLAEAPEGYQTRAECEAAVRWIKRYARELPVAAADLPRREASGED